MKTSSKIELAKAYFADLHKAQTRKDGVRPYFVHLLDVAERVSQVTDNEDVIIAALGHDSVEDVLGYTNQQVRHAFGLHVASLVAQLTDVYVKSAYPDLNRRTRKQLERERYKTFTPEAKWIKLSDIASNLNDDGTVLEADGQVEVGFNRMFIKEKALCLPYLVDLQDSRNVFLFKQAEEILKAQAKKFDVRFN